MRLRQWVSLVAYAFVIGASSAARAADATGVIPAIDGTISRLRLFESPQQPAERHYDDVFFYNAARYVYWEMTVTHAKPSRAASFTIEEVWYGPAGEIRSRGSWRFGTSAGNERSVFWGGARLTGVKTVTIDNPLYPECVENRRRRGSTYSAGDCSPTTNVDIALWPIGRYRVDLRVDGVTVATAPFVMWDKNQVNAEVRSKTGDHAAPSGRIDEIGARVRALRFFPLETRSGEARQATFATRLSAQNRGIGWELALDHATTHRWTLLPIEALLYFSDGSGSHLVQRKILQSAVPAAWRDTVHTDTFTWDEEDRYYWDRAGAYQRFPGRWLRGAYRLDLYVSDRKIASANFEVD